MAICRKMYVWELAGYTTNNNNNNKKRIWNVCRPNICQALKITIHWNVFACVQHLNENNGNFIYLNQTNCCTFCRVVVDDTHTHTLTQWHRFNANWAKMTQASGVIRKLGFIFPFIEKWKPNEFDCECALGREILIRATFSLLPQSLNSIESILLTVEHVLRL